jgi:hypothetical protein
MRSLSSYATLAAAAAPSFIRRGEGCGLCAGVVRQEKPEGLDRSS